MKKFKQARQGDILFRVTSKVPVGKSLPNEILAQGELTGHAHKIMDPPFSELDSVVDENGDIFIRSRIKEITIGHEEHGAITLPINQWIMITRQREYDPAAARRERKVAD